MNKLLLTSLLICFSVSANIFKAEEFFKEEKYQQALSEYQKDAYIGSIRAQYNLAIMFYHSYGIEKNLIEAYAWAATAGSSGSSTKQLTDELSVKLNPKELALAKQKSESYIQSFGYKNSKQRLAPSFAEKNSEKEHEGAHYLQPANFNKIVHNKKVSQNKPDYPRKALKKGSRGFADVGYDIFPDGSVRNAFMIYQYPHEEFAPSAIEFVTNQKYDIYSDDKIVMANKVMNGNLFRIKYSREGWPGLISGKFGKRIEDVFHSAQKGNIKDQHLYTELYYTVLNQNGAIDEKTINEWLFRAASQFGMSDSQYRLGNNIFSGRGCLIDEQKGLNWIIRAAQSGEVLAQYRAYQILSQLDLNNISDKAAIQWLQEAADNGLSVARLVVAKGLLQRESLSDSEMAKIKFYLRDYAENVYKTNDWYQANAIYFYKSGQYKQAYENIKQAIKGAKHSHWDMTEVLELKELIESRL